jgi:hypothetical protein
MSVVSSHKDDTTMSVVGGHKNDTTMSVVGGQKNDTTMSVVGGQKNDTTMSLVGGQKNDMTMSVVGGQENHMTMSVVGGRKNEYTQSRGDYTLCGGMHSLASDDDENFMWDNLVNKLSLIGLVPFDCGSSAGDCFFASMVHALYSDPGLHFQIRTAGIAHMSNNPELYIESLSGVSWQQYIQEMSQQGTWCDNVIIQAISNALDCTIYITDSNPSSANATVINPVHCCQNSRIVFLGYVNNLHYVSNLFIEKCS